MKNKIILLFCLALTFGACDKKQKKKDTSSPSTNASGRNKFSDTLVVNASPNSNEIFATHCSSSYNFYVVQKSSGSQYNLYKCDEDITLLFSKTIDLGPDKLIEIKGANRGDAFYTLSATNNFNTSNAQYINAYVPNNYTFDSTNHCTTGQFDYVYNPSFNVNPETRGVNYSIVNRFDGDGNLLWTKQLDGNYYSGTSLETDKDGNVFVLTANRAPITPILNTTFTTGLVPYYDLATDSNSFSIYKFDLFGNQLFKRTITHVKNLDFSQFNPSMVVSKTNIMVANNNNLFTFDLSGNLLSQNKPIANTCYSYVNDIVSNPFIDHIYVDGIIRYNSVAHNQLGYFAAFNNTTPTIISQSNSLNYTFLLSDNLENVYLGGETLIYISKLSKTGNFIYNSKVLYDTPGTFGISKKAAAIDGNNSLYGFVNWQTQIKVYKFDANGNYN